MFLRRRNVYWLCVYRFCWRLIGNPSTEHRTQITSKREGGGVEALIEFCAKLGQALGEDSLDVESAAN